MIDYKKMSLKLLNSKIVEKYKKRIKIKILFCFRMNLESCYVTSVPLLLLLLRKLRT